MGRRTILWAALLLLNIAGTELLAQDLGNIQIHGFATQGFLYSSNNNYLTMDSSRGSLQWTEGAISVTDPISDNLRVGIQLHMFQMGELGGPNIEVDWASGDYKVNDYLGFRAGKVKVPFGLFNDSQDVDSLFLWILLPQAAYPIDNRDFTLAVLGGELYGGLSLGKRAGGLHYRGYIGENRLSANDGYSKQLAEVGLTFSTLPSGRSVGGDVRWQTPWQPLMIGASEVNNAYDGSGSQVALHVPSSLSPAYYAQWDRGKLQLAAEYRRFAHNFLFTFGTLAVPLPVDERSWYPMVTYRLTKKLQAGSYYSHSINKAGGDPSQPGNHSKDWVISGRYDFNSYFYCKLETHFLHGEGVGYYTSDNPNGLKPDSKMLAARIGFAF